MPSDSLLYYEHKMGLTYAQIAQKHKLNPDSVRGRVNRHRRRADVSPLIAEHGAPLTLPPGDYAVAGDFQIPTHNQHFVERLLLVARQRLRRPRQLILAGDFINADAFSSYESDVSPPAFATEVAAARRVLDQMLEVFDRVYWLWGNHERRLGRRTNGALRPSHLWAMVGGDTRVSPSIWGHCVVQSRHGTSWRITHASEYSVNQLAVADMMAQKYQMNIISHHEHHLAIGFDRFKRYVIVNNGGLFDQDSMAYAVLDDSKRPRMQNGFTLLLDGFPEVYGPAPFTNWARVFEKGKK